MVPVLPATAPRTPSERADAPVPRSITSKHRGHLKRDLFANDALAHDRTIPHRTAGRIEDTRHPSRARDLSAPWKDRERRGQFERRHEAGAERQRGHIGEIAQSRIARQAQHVSRSDLLLQIGRSRIVRFEQRRSKGQLVRLIALAAARVPLGILGRRDVAQVREDGHGRIPALQRRRVHKWLEGGTGLAAAACGAVERAALVVCAADHRQNVAGGGIDRDERRLEAWTPQTLEAGGNGPLRGVLDGRSEGGVHLPVRRVVAAEFVAELLPQELLRPARTRVGRLPVWLDARPHSLCRLLFCRGDETELAHARKHQVAAIQGAVVVRPGRQRRWRADQPGNQRRLRERHGVCRLPEQVLRDRLHAVHAGAQINPVQVQLENLSFRQLRFDHHRDRRFLQLPPVGPDV